MDSFRPDGSHDFASLAEALVAWRKYEEHPDKVRAAKAAFDALCRLHGDPSRIYLIPTGTYVAITWPGTHGIGLMLHSGYIEGRLQQEGWLRAERSDWWWSPFSDFEDHTGTKARSSVPEAQCDCSPGIKQPVGLPCSRCEQIVRAPLAE